MFNCRKSVNVCVCVCVYVRQRRFRVYSYTHIQVLVRKDECTHTEKHEYTHGVMSVGINLQNITLTTIWHSKPRRQVCAQSRHTYNRHDNTNVITTTVCQYQPASACPAAPWGVWTFACGVMAGPRGEGLSVEWLHVMAVSDQVYMLTRYIFLLRSRSDNNRAIQVWTLRPKWLYE